MTHRMMKNTAKAAKNVNPDVPEFLEGGSQAGKRSRHVDGGIRSPFIPSWGICEQDSVLGSPSLALDWSKCSITPPDLLTVMAGDKMEEAGALGAQALYQANAYFQTSYRQGQQYQEKNSELMKEVSTFGEERRDWEAKVVRAESDALAYKKQVSSLQRKKTAEFQKVVQAYQESDAFLKFMDDHDDVVHPENMSIGWNRAVNVISDQYPEVVNPLNFPVPDWATSNGCYVELDQVPGDVTQASGSASRGSRRTTSSQSRGKRAVQPCKGKAIVRKPLPGKGLRNQLSSESSGEEENAGDQPSEGEAAAGNTSRKRMSASDSEESDSGSEESGSEEGSGEGEKRKGDGGQE